MHLHTPHLGNKREKRKASIEHSELPVTKKTTKEKKEPKPKKPAKPEKLKAKSQTPEQPHPKPASRSVSPEPTMNSPISMRRLSTAEFTTEPPTDGPRRSSRIKNIGQGMSDKWHKCRPYIERINGTIMPLEHQGTKAYYARDDVKM
ncbi:hypothetical protein EK21DRAFT_117532 [Setomelanomma holmii]|uniref:Uncharacterized protein n=1 Tax=Setomelanomma holmii TaxID=210430 RepID=A0A9P4GZA1_9PLEO|nr:hypothetical protein EK21DRAFT_117532 [Setomelanomma holmii]